MRGWLIVALVAAQWYPLPYRASINHDLIRRDTPDRGVSLCRLVFTSNRSEQGGNGWKTDWPLAERHLAIRLSETTTTHMALEGPDDDPVQWLVEPTSPALFRCPLVLTSDAGTLEWQPQEVEAMRAYLGKGGLWWSDDTWGDLAWLQLESAIRQIFPRVAIRTFPVGHPIYTLLYRVPGVPQISNLSFWHGSGGKTSERGLESLQPVLRGFYVDDALVVLATHDTDILDAAEREADSPAYFDAVAADGYAMAINTVLYSMTH